MNLTYVPNPLRLLLALSDPAQTELRRALGAMRPSVDLTCIRPNDLRAYLNEPNYYRVLCISPVTWRGLGPPLRQTLAAKVNLVFGMPEKANPTDFAEPRAALYFQNEMSPEQAKGLCIQLFGHLLAGKTLSECTKLVGDQLVFIGEENCWTLEEWTIPRKVPVEPDAPSSRNESVSVNVNGDRVQGSKTVVQASGDQVVHVRAEGLGKIVHQAGGDQVNTNRLAGANVEITQDAQGDQTNVNRVTNSAPHLEQSAGGDQANVNTVRQTPVVKNCSRCDKELLSDARFCMYCGKEQ